MSIILSEARRVLDKAVSSDSWHTAQKDRAIIAAGSEFLSLIPAATTATNITISNGAGNIDITDTIAGFTQNDWVDRASINSHRLRLAPYETVLRRWEDGTPTAGRPTLIGFRDDGYALLDRPADQEYTLSAVTVAGLTGFTIGTRGEWSSTATYRVDDVVQGDGSPDSLYYRCIADNTNQEPPNGTYWVVTTDEADDPDDITLNLPTAWAQQIVRIGAAAYLLAGGHLISAGSLEPGVGSLWQQWERVLQQARQDFPSTRNGQMDRNAPKGH